MAVKKYNLTYTVTVQDVEIDEDHIEASGVDNVDDYLRISCEAFNDGQFGLDEAIPDSFETMLQLAKVDEA